MPESEPHTQERVNVHERGGLTPAHWQLILDIDTSFNPLALGKMSDDNPIKRYAQAVVAGKIEDVNFTHRDYLHAFDWSTVIGNLQKPARSPRGILSMLRSPIPCRDLLEEAYVYAIYERLSSFSLAEILEQQRRRGINSNLEIEIEKHPSLGFYTYHVPYWNKDDHSWHYYLREKKHYSAHSSGVSVSNQDKTEGIEKYIDKIIRSWLLTTAQVPDPIHTGPEELSNILAQLIRSGDYSFQERISNWNYSHINIWLERDSDLSNYGEDSSVLTETLRRHCANSGDKIALASELQKIYHIHYGIVPFILAGEFYRRTILSHNGFLALRSRESALAMLNSPHNSILLEGEIEKDEDLPLIPVTDQLKAIP